MTWLTLRQLRASAATAYATLLLLAILLAITGPALAHLAATAGHDFLNRARGNPADSTLYDIGWIAVLTAPPLIGAFWGAPLISSELAAGTHRLVWNQTVSRTRWLAAKLVVCGAVAMAATGLLSLAVGWWSSPIDKALDATATSVSPAGFWFPRLAEETFAARGVVPAGYAAFAFMLGVTLGLLLRHLLPAMALTGVGYIAVQVVMNLWVRPALLAPEHLVMRINGDFNINKLGTILPSVPEPGAWITQEELTDNAGHPASMPSWARTASATGLEARHVSRGCTGSTRCWSPTSRPGGSGPCSSGSWGFTWRWPSRLLRSARTGSARGCPDPVTVPAALDRGPGKPEPHMAHLGSDIIAARNAR